MLWSCRDVYHRELGKIGLSRKKNRWDRKKKQSWNCILHIFQTPHGPYRVFYEFCNLATLCHMWTTKVHPRSLISAFVGRCLGSTLSLNPKFPALASFWSSTDQLSLSTWSHTHEDRFSHDVSLLHAMSLSQQHIRACFYDIRSRVKSIALNAGDIDCAASESLDFK